MQFIPRVNGLRLSCLIRSCGDHNQFRSAKAIFVTTMPSLGNYLVRTAINLRRRVNERCINVNGNLYYYP